MTPECPKGPEREARPEESLRDRLAQIISFQWGFDEKQFGATNADRIAAAVARVVVEPELERLTAEVERLRDEITIVRGVLSDGQDERIPSNVSTVQAARWLLSEHEEQVKHNEELGEESRALCDERDQLQAEVSRLREQLAAQTEQVERTRRAERRSIASVLTGMLEELEAAYVGEFGEGPAPSRDRLRAVQAFSVDLFATSSPVELDEFKSASPIIHTVLLSSDTGVMGEWQAFCSGCRQRSVGDLAHAEFWKDQHLADVLVPTLTNESFISSQDEDESLARQRAVLQGAPMSVLHDPNWTPDGRPSGSTAAAPHSEPTFSVDEMMASGWETAVAQGERDLLLKMAGELLEQCTDWDDQYGVCAESVPDPACRIRAIVNRYAIQPDAAQAAGSEATPEDSDVEHDDLADFPLENLRDWKSVQANVITRSPSPSLRKEGEGSD